MSSREIIFRGKSEVTNEWVYGSLVKVGNESHIVGFDEVDLDGHHLSDCSDRPVFTKQGTICQFTGLQDKNEKEIYEDDIVQITTTLDKYLFKVTWNEELGAWCLMMKGDIKEGTKPLGEWLGEYWDKIEVIGNIYDNPELMEEWI
jgi:uncharacterized phage protein (TIGR01671 family)